MVWTNELCLTNKLKGGIKKPNQKIIKNKKVKYVSSKI